MRMKNKLLFLLFTFTITINGQVPSIQFSKCIGSPQGNDFGSSILQTSDGGYILGCTTGYYQRNVVPNGENGDLEGGNGNGFRIFKIGVSGNIIWQTYVNGNYNGSVGGATSVLTSMVATNDGSYIVMGTTNATLWGSSNIEGSLYYSTTTDKICLAKISSSGTILWQKMCLPNNYNFYNNIIKKTNDGGYIITGRISYSGSEDYYLIKLDSNANFVWYQFYGTFNYDNASDVIQCPDGGYLINGTASAPQYGAYHPLVAKGGRDILVIKTDSSGNYIWSKCYGGTGQDTGAKLLNTSDGGFLITGTTNSNNLDVSNNHGGNDNWIIKTNSIGDIQWQKTYGGTRDDSIVDIIKSSDGNYVFSSTIISNDGDITFNNGNNKTDSWVVKINQTGTILWQKSFGGSQSDEISSIIQSSDNGYALTGSTNSSDGDIIGYHNPGYTNPPLDIMAIKISQDNLSTNIFKKDEILIYPNPANDHITIDCGTLANVSGWNIKITNILGQEVFSQPIIMKQYILPIKTWGGSGMYFVQIINSQGQIVDIKKIVLQ